MTCKSYVLEIENCLVYQGINCTWPCRFDNCLVQIIDGITSCLLFNCHSKPPLPPHVNDHYGLIFGLLAGLLILILSVLAARYLKKKYQRNSSNGTIETDQNQQISGENQPSISGGADNFFSLLDDEDSESPIVKPRRQNVYLENENWRLSSSDSE